jgi:hypothetical protein
VIGAAQAPAVAGAHAARATVPSSLRWRVVPAITGQELRDAVFGWALYLTATVAGLAGALLLTNAVRAVEASGLAIVDRPFYFPVLMAASLAALYLAGWTALAIARPRDQGALRVLFFAPVDPVGLVAAHALAGLAIAALILLLATPIFLVLGWLVNLPFPPSLLAGIAAAPLLLAPAIGIGLFISAIAPTARSAIFLYAAVLAGLIVVQVGYGALLQVPTTSRYYDALLFLREVVRIVREALQWLSPLALLSEGLDAAARANWGELLRHGASAVITGVVWLGLAAWALGRRGVLP